MEAFDTNVVVRLTIQDDEDQCRAAELAWRKAIADGGAFLATVVLVELTWVLRVAYKLDRSGIASILRRLTDAEGVHLEDERLVLSAVDAYEAGTADFADYVILASARLANALPLRTFDEALARSDGATLVR